MKGRGGKNRELERERRRKSDRMSGEKYLYFFISTRPAINEDDDDDGDNDDNKLKIGLCLILLCSLLSQA